MGRSRYKILLPDQAHFLTLSVLHWLPPFTRQADVDILFDSFRHLQNEGLKVYAYGILENHLHLMAQSPQLERDIACFKSFTSKQLLQLLQQSKAQTFLDQLAFYKKAHKNDRQYQFWQEGCHPQLIQDEDMMRQKIEYIHHNPVKRGFVDFPKHWRYSSARDYLGQKGLLKISVFN